MVREHVFGVKLKATDLEVEATEFDKFIAECRLTRDFWRVVVTATRAIILTLRDLPPAKRKVVDQKDWKFPRGLLASHPRHLYDDLGVKTKHLLGVPVEAAEEEEVEEEEEGKGTTKAKKGWRDRLEAYSDWKGAFAVLDLAADSNEKWRNLREWDADCIPEESHIPKPSSHLSPVVWGVVDKMTYALFRGPCRVLLVFGEPAHIRRWKRLVRLIKYWLAEDGWTGLAYFSDDDSSSDEDDDSEKGEEGEEDHADGHPPGEEGDEAEGEKGDGEEEKGDGQEERDGGGDGRGGKKRSRDAGGSREETMGGMKTQGVEAAVGEPVAQPGAGGASLPPNAPHAPALPCGQPEKTYEELMAEAAAAQGQKAKRRGGGRRGAGQETEGADEPSQPQKGGGQGRDGGGLPVAEKGADCTAVDPIRDVEPDVRMRFMDGAKLGRGGWTSKWVEDMWLNWQHKYPNKEDFLLFGTLLGREKEKVVIRWFDEGYELGRSDESERRFRFPLKFASEHVTLLKEGASWDNIPSHRPGKR
eukprot:jgi/Mesvir1/10669/Mv13761-RA.1